MDFFCKHSVIMIIREHTCIRQPRVIIVCDIGYMWESVKSVIPIPSELNFEEYATIDDQLQVTHLMSNSEITNSIAKTNDDANNSRENNSDDEESPVSINEAYNSVQTLRKFLVSQTETKAEFVFAFK
ncbi:hypothetical protein T06_1064 [Trichinella sp. T6]|nr:hypothetical protein T06_1064 [Trichinella sp. T6]